MFLLFFYYLIRGEKMQKEFEIIKVGEDEYELKSLTNDVVLPFKRNVKLAKEIQNINADAKLDMIAYMKDKGLTKQDLIDKKIKNGKTYYDETLYRELEQTFVTNKALEVISRLPDIMFGLNAEELAEKIGIKSNEEGERLGSELASILKNNTPSYGSKKEVII